MTLKPREKAILSVTIALAVIGLVWFVAVGPLYDEWELSRTNLGTAQKEYDDNVKMLKDRPRIEREYDRIRQTIPTESMDENTAEFAFTENVTDLSTRIMGGKKPQMRKVEQDFEPFKAIKTGNFVLLNLPVSTKGNLESIAQLLKAFDREGYLLRKVTVVKPDIDATEFNLDLIVSRVVSIQQDTTRRRRRI